MFTRISSITVLIAILAFSYVNGQELEKPVLIRSSNKVIDIKPCYAAPAIYDYNQDGLNDLILGDFNGNFRIYLNIGSKETPEYRSPFFIKVNGKKAKIPNW